MSAVYRWWGNTAGKEAWGIGQRARRREHGAWGKEKEKLGSGEAGKVGDRKTESSKKRFIAPMK
jgi:hypothetical protein